MVSDKKHLETSLFRQLNYEFEGVRSVAEICTEVDESGDLDVFVSLGCAGNDQCSQDKNQGQRSYSAIFHISVLFEPPSNE